MALIGTAAAISMLGELSPRTIYVRKRNAKTNGFNEARQAAAMKWLILGVGFVVVMALVAFGTLMMLGGDNASVSESETTHESEKVKKDAKKETKPKMSADRAATAEEEYESMLSKMMENLAVLDYVPGPDEMMTQDGSMSIQDSTDGANWLEKEKHKLAKRERSLDLKQRELEKVDRKVSQKLLRIEQAESSRINQLAKLYDSMDPQAVAQLMRNLEDEIVVELLPRMKSKNAAIVLSLLPPKRAANLSKQMITLAEK